MNVLLITNMYPSADDPAYGSFVARQQGRLTTEHGISFSVVASRSRGGNGASLVKYLKLAKDVFWASVGGGYDLVHAHYLLPTAALALFPAWLRRKPLVITAHGTDIYTGRRAGWRGLIRRAVRRACRVFVVSQFLARELLEQFGAPRGDLIVANMGVDTGRFAPGDKKALKAMLGMNEQVPHLAFVGNFVEQKGVEDLAEALALLAERGVPYRASLVGEGPLKEGVEERLHDLGDRIRFAPFTAHTQLPALFGATDLFVLPSRREGVGLLVCLEALACGAPVATTTAGGLPEIVKDGENGLLVPPEDPTALADAIQSVLYDPQRLARLASAARPSALAYDEREQAALVAAAYSDCVKAGR